MDLPVMPPVRPMLAKAVHEMPPAGELLFEPKWDGFRCIVFRDGDEVELGSRNDKPLTRYFPELPPLLRQALPDRCVVDGEIVVAVGAKLEFEVLQQRIHPAESRVNMLAEKTPASFVAFDLLALGDEDLRGLPFRERRKRLEEILAKAKPPVHITPNTEDRVTAEDWFDRFEGAGFDGVMAKDPEGAYLENKRAQLKVKHKRTADCVVAGYRTHKDGEGVGSLLMGVYDDEGELHHLGVAASFSADKRKELIDELAPYEKDAMANHPWRQWADMAAHEEGGRKPGVQNRWTGSKDQSWHPLRLELVAEVTYDGLQSGRFRHTSHWVRWRKDKEPGECTYDQFSITPPAELEAVFGRTDVTAIVPGLAGRASAGVRWPMLVLVALVGTASGLVAATFVAVLRALTEVFGPEHWSDLGTLLVLGAVGAAIALITLVLGNPGDVELLVNNIHVSGGRSDIRDLRSLLPVSLLGIAAGSAIGPEAPLVQTTGSIGSWVGLRLRLGEDELRLLTISGMAAGFTVLLGVPLGSAIFALEILHRRGLQYYEALLPALVGALSGYGVYVAITHVGLDPALHLPRPAPLEPGHLLLAVGLGVAGAVLAAVFTYGTQVLRVGWRRVPLAIRPIIGGLALGGLAFLSPYALTFGEDQISHLSAADLTVAALVGAGLVKLLASALIVTAGWRGGFIIPLFFVGAAFGAAIADTFDLDRGIVMAALMVATNVGVTKTPLGSTLIVAEMAGFTTLPTTLVAALVALLLTSRVGMIDTQRNREGEH